MALTPWSDACSRQLLGNGNSSFHCLISILLLLIFLTVSYEVFFSLCTPLFSYLVFHDHVFFSRSLVLHILVLSQSAVSEAPVGTVLRVILCVCVREALIFYLRQVHISRATHRPAAGPELQLDHEDAFHP